MVNQPPRWGIYHGDRHLINPGKITVARREFSVSLIRRWVQRYGPELEQWLRLGNTGVEPLLGSCTRGPADSW